MKIVVTLTNGSTHEVEFTDIKKMTAKNGIVYFNEKDHFSLANIDSIEEQSEYASSINVN